MEFLLRDRVRVAMYLAAPRSTETITRAVATRQCINYVARLSTNRVTYDIRSLYIAQIAKGIDLLGVDSAIGGTMYGCRQFQFVNAYDLASGRHGHRRSLLVS